MKKTSVTELLHNIANTKDSWPKNCSPTNWIYLDKDYKTVLLVILKQNKVQDINPNFMCILSTATPEDNRNIRTTAKIHFL